MRVDDGAEFRGRLQSRHEVRRDHRRHGQDRVVVLDRQLVVTEIKHGDLAIGETERSQPVSELDLHIVRGEKAQRRLDKDGTEPVPSDERPAGTPPRK